jgi:hypothetical protein
MQKALFSDNSQALNLTVDYLDKHDTLLNNI